MPQHQTREVIQRFLQLLTSRSLDELTQLFAEDIDWNIPGDQVKAPWLGKRKTRQKVSAFYTMLWENTEPVAANIDHIFTEDNSGVITGSFSTKMLPTGKMVDSMFCISLTVEDGLITKYRLLEDSYAVSIALTVA